MTVSECCLIKLLPYILYENYIYILALEMATQGAGRHCASCIVPYCVRRGLVVVVVVVGEWSRGLAATSAGRRRRR